MSPSQMRVVDPVLTTFVQGYQHNERVGSLLFPRVNVLLSAGKVIEFGKESFMLYNSRRAPGGATKRVDFGYVGKPYDLIQDSLEGKVPREFQREASGGAGVDLGMRAASLVMNSLTLNLEYEQAAIATDQANYDNNHKIALSGTDKWADPVSKPIPLIEAGRQAIRSSCGMYPNVMICGPKVYSALRINEQISAKFRNTDIITSAMLANLFEINQVVEGKAVYAGNDGTFNDIWGNFCVLAYAPQSPSGFEQPSYGYTYTMNGNPAVEQSYYEANAKSDIYPVTFERRPVLTGMIAGYLFTNVI